MRYLLLLIILALTFTSHAQSPLTTGRGDFSQHLTDRLFHQVKDSSVSIFSSWKPYNKREIVELTNLLSSNDPYYNYLKADNWEYDEQFDNNSRKPLFKELYKSNSDLFYHHGEDIQIHINPVIQFQVGNDSQTNSLLYTNTRGIQLHGTIDQKVSFYTLVTENQLRYPAYIREFQQEFGVIPGRGFWKSIDEDAYDFIFASGHVNFQATKHINIELGHDRFFIGNGYRSLFLSDFGNNYPYLKIKTKIWKFQYTNLYAQLTGVLRNGVNFGSVGTFGIGEFPKKFMTAHHLSIDVSKKVTIGLFESIIFDRSDSLSSNPFELSYLNPLIFYRAVEQDTGSPDNALLGVEGNWQVFKTVSLYGQFVFDEFITSELFGNRGSINNKYAYQLGAKYFDVFGIERLDLQVEHNFGRPFVYAHDNPETSFAHYNQPLAHPLGANFSEWLAILRYRITPKLYLYGKLLIAETGKDPDGDSNVGRNILLPLPTRVVGGDNNFVGQGVNTQLFFGEFRASYMLKHNLFIDLSQIVRRENSEVDALDVNSNITSVGIRLNLSARDITF